MFGTHQRPPRPPRFEPFLLVVLAIAIAAVLTLGYAGVLLFVERLQQAAP